jgi:hypothetical protein
MKWAVVYRWNEKLVERRFASYEEAMTYYLYCDAKGYGPSIHQISFERSED